jgi:hypothetical protein
VKSETDAEVPRKCLAAGCQQLAAAHPFLLTTKRGFREVWACLWHWFASAKKESA